MRFLLRFASRLVGSVLGSAFGWASRQVSPSEPHEHRVRLYRGELRALADHDHAVDALARQFSGKVTVRFTSLRRVCVIRSSVAPGSPELLLSVARVPWARTFHGYSAFNVRGLGWIRLRLVPLSESDETSYSLQYRQARWGGSWMRIAVLKLENPEEESVRELSLLPPPQVGAGVRPAGFLYHLRKGAERARRRRRGSA